MKTRRGKTIAQQCRHYDVENIYEYMISVYINGNIENFRALHAELCKDAKRQFAEYIFDEVPPVYHQEIIIATI